MLKEWNWQELPEENTKKGKKHNEANWLGSDRGVALEMGNLQNSNWVLVKNQRLCYYGGGKKITKKW